jgi:hypothetical protein
MFHSRELSWARMFWVVLASLITLTAPAAHAQAGAPAPLLEPTARLDDVPLPPDTPGPCAEFGCYNGSVLDGDTLAARGDEYHGVYVFRRAPDRSLGLQALLSNPELATPTDDDFEFGLQLALGGDVLLASGSSHDVPKVYVFRRDGTSWSYQQALPGPAIGLLVSHRTAFIATGVDVRVFEPNLRGVFRQSAVLKPPEPVANSAFGSALSFDGLTAVFGAPIQTGYGGAGAAYAFDRFFAFWVFVQKFTPGAAALDPTFASSVAIDRERLAIGAPGTPGALPNRPGVVQTYVRRGWQWRAGDRIDNPIPDDGEYRSFGDALDLQRTRLLVSGSIRYPFAAPAAMNYLFDVRGTPRIVAVLDAASARSVQLSAHTALIDQQSVRLGTSPVLFDIPD